jgi:hypothetical protein
VKWRFSAPSSFSVSWDFSTFLGGDIFQAGGGSEVHSENYRKL